MGSPYTSYLGGRPVKGSVVPAAGNVLTWDDTNKAWSASGTITPTIFTFPGSTSPSQTGEGQAVWDTDDDLLTIGTGTGRKTVVNTDSSQVLTNKTISGASNTLSNIGNSSLTNSSVTLGSTSVSLGATATTLTGLTLSGPTLSGTVSGTPTWASTQTLNTSGNAATATALQTARAINGVNFDGTAAITVTAAAGTLTGSTLASGVTASSLTSLGTLTELTVNGVSYVGDIQAPESLYTSLQMRGSDATGHAPVVKLNGPSSGIPYNAVVQTPNAAHNGDVTRLTLTDGTTATATWANVTHSGFKLGGALDANSQNITSVGTVSATTLTGTLSTAAQPNITSLGTLTALATTGSAGIGTSSPNDWDSVSGVGGVNFQVRGAGSQARIIVQDSQPVELHLVDTGAAANDRIWRLTANNSGDLILDQPADGYGSAVTSFTAHADGSIALANTPAYSGTCYYLVIDGSGVIRKSALSPGS